MFPIENPVIWADVPDPSIVRVGDTYYMTSTTMHMNPGVPIMKSTDLIHWQLVGYAYDTLDPDNPALNMEQGQDAYGAGSWASSIRYVNGIFYVSTFAKTTNKTYIFSTADIEAGQWKSAIIDGALHDSSLLFDEGRVYLVYGNSDIRIVELDKTASRILPGGLQQRLIKKAELVAGPDFLLGAEGSHIQKIDGYYYLSLICWPLNGMRTQLIYRSKSLTGPYEGRVAFQHRGIAQGGLVETNAGRWYGFLFRDAGAVGRMPYLIPVRWEDGWPLYDLRGERPAAYTQMPGSSRVEGIVTSDEFSQDTLPLQWQWNHNPDASGWSLSERPGFLRLINRRLSSGITHTRNTLTQRTFGPTSEASVAMDVSGMKDGDTAGLGLLQKDYGFVGVTHDGGKSFVVMRLGNLEVTRLPLQTDRIYFRTRADFRDQLDQAQFFYSLDGENWQPIGDTLQMDYTLPHFMGYRFALFNFATRTPGGQVDFDFFRVTR